MSRTPLVVALTLLAALATPACKDETKASSTGEKSDKGDKDEKSTPKIADMKMTAVSLGPKLPLTIQAPKGSKVEEEFGVVRVKKAPFEISVHESPMRLGDGEEMFSPFEKQHLKKTLVAETDLLVWKSDSDDMPFFFRTCRKVGDKWYVIEGAGMTGVATREDVDALLASAKTLKSEK